MRLKNDQETKKLQEIRDQIESEKRRKRATMPLDELVRTTILEDVTAYKKKQRKELERFLDMRAGLDKDGTEFMQMLDQCKMHFGPYALQLAEEYFNKQMKRFEAKIDPAKKDE